MEQVAFPFLWLVSKDMRRAELRELLPCQKLHQACYIALRHARATQDAIAAEIHCSKGLMSMLMHGKAEWTDKRLVAFMKATKSLAPLQWQCMRAGGTLEPNPDLERIYGAYQMKHAAEQILSEAA